MMISVSSAIKKVLLLSILVFQLLSCSGAKHFHFKMPERIAVLPTINQTTDVLGGIVFRHLLYIELEDEYAEYLLSLESVDTLLNEEGITDGGQLNTIEQDQLFQILNANGLLYIDLLACEYQTLGISETRRVKARFRLISPSNHILWDYECEVDEGKSAFDTFFQLLGDPKEALKDTAEDFGKQIAEKGGRMWLLQHALKPEMEAVIAV